MRSERTSLQLRELHPPISIAIAVVNHAGHYLVGLRGDDAPLPGLAEFPGGKCRSSESPQACAVRECLEETGLRIVVSDLLCRIPYDYPHAQVDLHFFLCRPAEIGEVAEQHNGFRWISATSLHDLKFPPANDPVIVLLRNRTLPEVHKPT